MLHEKKQRKVGNQFTNLIYIDIDIYKQDLALNNLQELIYHKTQPTNLYKIWSWLSSPTLHEKKERLAINWVIFFFYLFLKRCYLVGES